MAEMKATSFRISEEDVEKFKAFMEKEGIKTQAEGFKSIMQTVELAQAKGIIKNREKEIELFEDTINRLMGYYLNSLEINQHSEQRIREQLSKEIDTKDTVITNLQAQLKALKEENSSLNNSYKNIESNNKQLQQQVTDLNKSITEKNSSIEMLNRNNNNLQDQLAEYKQYKDQYKDLEKQLEQLQAEIKEKNNNINTLVNTNQQLQNQLTNKEEMLEIYKNDKEELKESINSLLEKHKEELKEIKLEHKEQLKEAKLEYKAQLKEAKEEKITDYKLKIDNLKKALEEAQELNKQYFKSIGVKEREE